MDTVEQLLVTIRRAIEKHGAEEALWQLAAVMADSNDALTIQDFDGTIIAWNQGAERMYGYSQEEALGNNFDDMMPEEKWAEFRELVAQIQSGNLVESLETHRLTRDGRMLDVWLTISPLTDDHGNILAISTTERDITERKRAEEELKRYRDHLEKLVEQRTTEFVRAIEKLRREIAERKRIEEALRQGEEELRAIFDGARDGIIVLDKTGKVVRINKYVEEIGGYAEDELVGKRIDVLEMVPSQSMEKILAAYDVLEKGQDVPPYEIEVHLKTGEKRISEVHSSLVRQREGVVGIVGILRDVTERKRAEEAIKQRNRELAALLKVSQRLASRLESDELLSDIAHSIVETLPAAEASSLWLYDERSEELVARAWSGYDDEAISGLALSPDTSLVGLVYRTRQPHIVDDVACELAFEVVDRPGLDVMCSALGVPLLVEGQSIGALFADNFSRPQAFDENDLRLLQSLAAQAAVAIQNAQLFEQVRDGRQRLQALSRRLVEVQEAERRYIALELHDEIGQILTGLKLSLEVATRLPADEVMPSLNEAKALLDELIIQVDDLSLDLRPTMLDDLGLLPALLWHFDRYTAQTNVRVTFQHVGLEGRRFEPELETAAYRIVQEALTNVARHAGVNEVVVRTWADQKTLGVQIEDQGPGFDPEAVLAAGDTTGLPGMRDRAVLLGGQLTVESVPATGTRLTTEFPLGHRALERRGMER
jgi:PAS domain S-box-containing protein